MVEKSKVIGIMLQHSDGDKEYYEPELLKEDIEAIFKILEKYGDDNDSVRGDLKVINQEENTEDIDSDFEHTSKEMADKLMEFNRDFSDDSETSGMCYLLAMLTSTVFHIKMNFRLIS